MRRAVKITRSVSSRQHPSNDDCLDGKTENMLYYVRQLHNNTYTQFSVGLGFGLAFRVFSILA